MKNGVIAITLAVPAAAAALASPAMSADEFYKGKTVRVIVGYAPGGAYDTYARFMARNLGKYLPGKPSVITMNMPGAGSLKAANYIYNNAPKDGSVFGTFGRSMPIQALLSRKSNIRFDATKFTWIGTATSYASDAYLMLVRADGPAKNINDLRKKGGPRLVLGSTNVGSTGTDIPLVLRQVLGLNTKQLSGYPGGSAINLAIQRNEVHGRMAGMSPIKSNHPEWLTSRKIMIPLLQFARETRHPELPDVPLAMELATNAEDKALIEMVEMPFKMANPFAAPPAIPAGRAKVLRDAFYKAVSSKEYRDLATKRGMEVSPRSGDHVQAIVEKFYALPKKVIQRYEEILTNPALEPRKVVWIKESGKITKLAKKNRRVTFDHGGKARQTSIAGGGYTTVKIKGKKASRNKLKVGMTCEITYEGHKTAAQMVSCK